MRSIKVVVDIVVNRLVIVDTVCVASLMQLSGVVRDEVVVCFVLQDWIEPPVSNQDLVKLLENNCETEASLTAWRSICAVPVVFS